MGSMMKYVMQNEVRIKPQGGRFCRVETTLQQCLAAVQTLPRRSSRVRTASDFTQPRRFVEMCKSFPLN